MTHYAIMLCIGSALLGITIIVALRASRILYAIWRKPRIISSESMWRLRGQVIVPFIVLAILGPELMGMNWRWEVSGAIVTLIVVVVVAVWYFWPPSSRRK